MQLVTAATIRWGVGTAVAAMVLLAMGHEVRIGGEPHAHHPAATQPALDLWSADYAQGIWHLCAQAPGAAACATDAARAIVEPPPLELPSGAMALDDAALRASDRYRDNGMPRGRVLLGDRAADDARRVTDGAERQLARWLLRP